MKQLIFILNIILFIRCKDFKGKENDENPQNKHFVKQEKTNLENAKHFTIVKICDQSNEENINKIRLYCNEVNSINNWGKIKTIELETTNEMGEGKLYYIEDSLKKIVTKEYRESFQILTEYYLTKNIPLFIYEKHFKYNRPIYYSKQNVKEDKDNEYFDLKKSIITENRTYYLEEQLICQKCDSNFAFGNLNKDLNQEFDRFKNQLEIILNSNVPK